VNDPDSILSSGIDYPNIESKEGAVSVALNCLEPLESKAELAADGIPCLVAL